MRITKLTWNGNEGEDGKLQYDSDTDLGEGGLFVPLEAVSGKRTWTNVFLAAFIGAIAGTSVTFAFLSWLFLKYLDHSVILH